MKIFDILPVGEENAISAKALSAKLGLRAPEHKNADRFRRPTY